MSKKQLHPNGSGPLRDKFTTSMGVEVSIGPLPLLLESHLRASLTAEWLEAGKTLPTVPTYEIKTAAGDTELHEVDSTVLDDPERKARWDEYQAAKAEFEAEHQNRLLRAVVIDCVEFEENPRWAAKHRAKKLRVPEDEWERKVYFAETELVGNPEDLLDFINRAAAMSGLKEEVLNKAKDSFRHSLEETPDPQQSDN